MKLDVALLADAATVDASGKLNVLGIFHRIRGPRFPLRHGRVALVLRLQPEEGDEGKLAVAIQLLGPDGDQVLRLNGEVEGRPGTAPERVRIPQVLNLDGVVFPAPGQYRFVISVDEEEVGELPILVEEGTGRKGRSGPSGGSPTPVIVPPGSEGGVQA
jgi:hypothetical protein